MNKKTKYNIYIPSKNRHDICITVDSLEACGINNYKLVVEPQDYNNYKQTFGSNKLLQLDKNNGGIGYARQFIKTHASNNNELYHWQLDDDLKFKKRVDNKNIPYFALDMFIEVETYVDKYTNIGQAGFRHQMFAWTQTKDISLNKQVAGCVIVLSKSSANYRTETIEDIDFSMQTVSTGYVTAIFNRLLIDTPSTGTQKGGNTGAIQNDRMTELQENFVKEWGEDFSVEYLDNPKRPSRLRASRVWNKFKQKPKLKNKIAILKKPTYPNQPKYPLYIVSKGRWDIPLTSEALCGQEVKHNIVIENQEYKQYKNNINHDYANLLVLDPKYQDEYDTCDDLGDTKSKGLGAARNFAWQHSIDNGHDWHWVMDDNINLFIRLTQNRYIPTYSGGFWRAMEDFMTRYENLGMGGPEYYMFITRRKKYKPFRLNTRIYSCNFIRNSLPYRWRGRYNEDTILSLDMLKDKWCTMIFHTFLQWKQTTQTVKGGNTKEFYEKEGTLAKSKMQVAVHPDVSELVWKYNRWHHKVDYAKFKTRPKLRKDIKIQKGNNEYGMTIKQHRER